MATSLGYKLIAFVAALLLFDSHLPVAFLRIRVRPPLTFLDIAGFVITVAGIGFAIWARFALKGNWSSAVTVKQDHELIQNGPYAILRHPIYAGFSLAALGTAITIGEVRGFIAVVLSVFAWRLKWGAEEAYMSEQFGAQYTGYKRRVKAIVPGIW
jgi:protein-S-isoprenylcysteine O-methyltransferase